MSREYALLTMRDLYEHAIAKLQMIADGGNFSDETGDLRAHALNAIVALREEEAIANRDHRLSHEIFKAESFHRQVVCATALMDDGIDPEFAQAIENANPEVFHLEGK